MPSFFCRGKNAKGLAFLGLEVSGNRSEPDLARVMLSKAPILILDEATSALDSVTEKYIKDSLDKLMSNRTTISDF